MAVGATSSGPSRGTETGVDGRLIYEALGVPEFSVEGYPWICLFPFLGMPSSSTEQADIDSVAWFSSYGPSTDGRIKPEVVAPGDQVRPYFTSRNVAAVAFALILFFWGLSSIYALFADMG